MAVALRCESDRGRSYAVGMRADARRLMALVGMGACDLSIVIADDDFVHALNRKFRGQDRPTDVLSFPQFEDAEDLRARAVPRGRRRTASPVPSPPGLLPQPAPAHAPAPAAATVLGDVVISVETARRQARHLRVAPAARMRTLLVHGLLHLLGYDHERSPTEARRMFARERELTAALRGAGARKKR